jgi:hypothetical protein
MNKMQNLGLAIVFVVVASHIQNITDMVQLLGKKTKFKDLTKPQQTKFIMTIIELLLYIIAAILCLLSFK